MSWLVKPRRQVYAEGESEIKPVKVAFDEWHMFRHFEFPDITARKLESMTSIPLLATQQRGHNAILSHKSAPRRALTALCFWLALFNIIVEPLFVAFGMAASSFELTVFAVIRTVFCLDLLVNFITGKRLAEGDLAHEVLTIAKHYLAGWLWIDLASAIPPSFFGARDISVEHAFDPHDPSTKLVPSVGSIAVLVIAFAKFVREFQRLVEAGGMFNSTRHPEILLSFEIVIFVLVLLHAFCTTLLLCCQAKHSTWFEQATEGEQVDNVFEIYSVYMQGSIMYMFADGQPRSLPERWFAICMTFFGLFFSALMVGQITNWIQQRTAKHTKWRVKMQEVNDSMSQMGIDPVLQERIRNYYAFSWAINGGEDRGHQWLSELSDDYHEEVCIQVNEKLIASVPIFKQANKAFVHAIVMSLKQQLFLPADYVVRCGDIGHEMYFVVRGTLQAMDQQETAVFNLLREGSFFGEIALLKRNAKRTATVRSYTYAELNVLFREDFEHILAKHPEDTELILQEAKLREKNSQNVTKIMAREKSRSNRLSGVSLEEKEASPAQEDEDDAYRSLKGSSLLALADRSRSRRGGTGDPNKILQSHPMTFNARESFPAKHGMSQEQSTNHSQPEKEVGLGAVMRMVEHQLQQEGAALLRSSEGREQAQDLLAQLQQALSLRDGQDQRLDTVQVEDLDTL